MSSRGSCIIRTHAVAYLFASRALFNACVVSNDQKRVDGVVKAGKGGGKALYLKP
jgi:hypothetical protein